MSSYQEGYYAAKNESGWSEFLGFILGVFIVWLLSGWIASMARESERERIDDLLKPYGVTIEHLQKQADIAKEKKLAEPIKSLTCVQGSCTSMVEKAR